VDGNNVLSDFAQSSQFKQEFGEHQWPIDPRKFRLSGESRPTYDQIRPLLERVEYFFPGSRKQLEGVFDKPWLVLDREFPSRTPGERKVVSQTSKVVYLSYSWLIGAQPVTVNEAFVHEAVRNWSTSLLEDIAHGSLDDDHDRILALADRFTEILTPLIYRDLPLPVISETMGQLFGEVERMLGEENFKSNPIYLATRPDVYKHLAGTRAQWLIEKVCQAAKITRNPSDQLENVSKALAEVQHGADLYFFSSYRISKDSVTHVANNLSPDQHDLAMLFDSIGDWVGRSGGSGMSQSAESTRVQHIIYLCVHLTDENMDLVADFSRDQGRIIDPFSNRPAKELPPNQNY
jgi:hypothetical protein